MTHKPGHKTHPHYDALPWETKKRFDDAMKGKGKGIGDPTKKKKHQYRPENGDSRLKVNQ